MLENEKKNIGRLGGIAHYINITQKMEDGSCVGVREHPDEIVYTQRTFGVYVRFVRTQRFVTITSSKIDFGGLPNQHYLMYAKFYLNPPKEYVTNCLYNNTPPAAYTSLKAIYEGPVEISSKVYSSQPTSVNIIHFMNDMVKIPVWRNDIELAVIISPNPTVATLPPLSIRDVTGYSLPISFLPKRKFFYLIFEPCEPSGQNRRKSSLWEYIFDNMALYF